MLNEIRRNTREDFYGLWDGWRPRTKRLPSVWATQVRRIAAGQSPLTHGEDIGYSHDVMPHCVEAMDAADDPEVSIIILWWAKRMGKSEGVCANIIGRTITDDPKNILDDWPVEDSSARWSRDVIEPMFEATPALNEIVVTKRSRDSGRTIDYKRFHGGSLYIVNAGSKNKFRGMAAPVVLCHEVDAYPASSQGEGDPIEKALGRAEGFGDQAIKIIESTGTLAAEIDDNGKKKYRSNIEKWFDRSDQRKWFCPCRKCGEGQWLKFDQITAITKKSGTLFFYLCELCQAAHDSQQWRRMVKDGKWKPTAPFSNGIRGYWINQFNSLLPTGKGFKNKLHQFHAEGARAMSGTPEEKQVWVNEVKNELYEPESEELEPAPQYKPIFESREDYGTDEKIIVPSPGMIITAFTDVHANRLETEWKAWSKTGESWALKHSVIDGSNRSLETWEELAHRLKTKFEHASGHMLPLTFSMIDCGWGAEWPARLFFGDVFRRPENQSLVGKIRASKGLGKPNAKIVAQKWATIDDGANSKVSLKGVHIGTWEAKDTIYERLRELDKAGCRMHFPKSFTEEFFQQLTIETVVFKFIKGMIRRTYDNPKSLRNEALDLEVGNLAAFMFRKWDFESVEARLNIPVSGKPEPEEKPSDDGVVMIQPGTGWKI